MREFSYYRDATAYKNTNLTTSVAIAQAVFMLFDGYVFFDLMDKIELTLIHAEYHSCHPHLFKTFCKLSEIIRICEAS